MRKHAFDAFFPVRKQASEVDPRSRKLELRVISYHRDVGAVSSIVLFDARQSAREATIAAGDYLVNPRPDRAHGAAEHVSPY